MLGEGRHGGRRFRRRARRGEEPLVIGAPGAAGGGAVYVFERGSDGRWSERARLTAKGGTEGDWAQPSRLHGVCCSWGAPGRDGERGTVVVFARGRSAGEWTQRGAMQPATTAAGDWFGAAVAFDGQRALVGAPAARLPPRFHPVAAGTGLVFRCGRRPSGPRRRVSHRRRRRQWFDGSGGPARRHRGTRRRAAVDSLAGMVVRFTRQARPGHRPAPSLPTPPSGRPASDPRWPAIAATSWSELRSST